MLTSEEGCKFALLVNLHMQNHPVYTVLYFISKPVQMGSSFICNMYRVYLSIYICTLNICIMYVYNLEGTEYLFTWNLVPNSGQKS